MHIHLSYTCFTVCRAGDVRDTLTLYFGDSFKCGNPVTLEQRTAPLPPDNISALGEKLKWVGRRYATEAAVEGVELIYQHWKYKRDENQDQWRDGVMRLGEYVCAG